MESDFIRLTVLRAFVTNTLAFAAIQIQERLQGEFGRTWTTVWCFALVFIGAVLAEYVARQLIEKIPLLRRFFFVAARLEGWWLHEWKNKDGGLEIGLMHIKLERGRLAVNAYCMTRTRESGVWIESGVLTSHAVSLLDRGSSPTLTIAYKFNQYAASEGTSAITCWGCGQYVFHENSYAGEFIDSIDNRNLPLTGFRVSSELQNQLNGQNTQAELRAQVFGELYAQHIAERNS
jgi:hypothetical protein